MPPAGSKFEADLRHAVLDGLCPNVQSVRSLPAQIAVAFAPESHSTSSESGFPNITGEAPSPSPGRNTRCRSTSG